MDNTIIWISILVISVILGLLDRAAHYSDGQGRIFWLMETWRHIIGFFFGGIAAYFFIEVRWPQISTDGSLSGSDFILALIFLIGVLGWIPHFVKNVTEGINVLMERFLKR